MHVSCAVKIVYRQRYPNQIFSHVLSSNFILYFFLKSILKYFENSKKFSLGISQRNLDGMYR